MKRTCLFLIALLLIAPTITCTEPLQSSANYILKDRVILITGSTTGIGEAIARKCVARGAKVMIHGLEEPLARLLQDELGSQVSYICSDLSDADNCDALIRATVNQFGALHCLVNNAAATTRSTIETSDAALFDKIMSVNLKAPLLLSRAAIAQFRKQGDGGNILNIGSTNAYCGLSELLLYSISKGGLMTLTRNLSDTLSREKIRVNQLNVGWTATPNEIALKESEGMPKGWQNNVPDLAPIGRIFTPQEIAEHALFWISDLSFPVSGTICEVEQFPVIGPRHTRLK